MKKKMMIVGGILLAVMLLFPVRYSYKDGGSVEYRAILYSVTDYHVMNYPDEPIEGIGVKIMGIEVFNNTGL